MQKSWNNRVELVIIPAGTFPALMSSACCSLAALAAAAAAATAAATVSSLLLAGGNGELLNWLKRENNLLYSHSFEIVYICFLPYNKANWPW